MTNQRRVAILGCTGSVGRQALELLGERQDRFRVTALVARSSERDLLELCARFQPRAACLVAGNERPRGLAATTAFFSGEDGVLGALEAEPPDVVLNAITGAAGLPASEWTLRRGSTLALANKESLVMAGPWLMELARASGARILPVDSEHCAIFQCLQGSRPEHVRRIWLTGSGGPFRSRPLAGFAAITPAEALRHPTWKMGPRITIGSATMMNKAFEIVEARWLFGVSPEQIEVVIHPQSIVHSMVEFVDGSMLAQLGLPDMRVPILYCLAWPERVPFAFQPFDMAGWKSLEFEPLDPARYPAVPLGREVLQRGGDSGAVLNAADEVLTEMFLAGKTSFPEITRSVTEIVRARPPRPIAGLADVMRADREARDAARARCTAAHS